MAIKYLDYWLLGLYSLSGRTSYREISWSLEAARLGVIMIVSLWNFTGISATLLPTHACQISERLEKSKPGISRLRDFTRSYGKTSDRLKNRGPSLSYLCQYPGSAIQGLIRIGTINSQSLVVKWYVNIAKSTIFQFFIHLTRFVVAISVKFYCFTRPFDAKSVVPELTTRDTPMIKYWMNVWMHVSIPKLQWCNRWRLRIWNFILHFTGHVILDSNWD